MILSTQSKAAGGQKWHRQKVRGQGMRIVGTPKPSWLQGEAQPVENLKEKQQVKEQVRESVQDIDPALITVVPEGKKAKRKGKRK